MTKELVETAADIREKEVLRHDGAKPEAEVSGRDAQKLKGGKAVSERCTRRRNLGGIPQA